MLEITAKELKELIDKKVDFQLVDVREPHEFDDMNLNGELIPMGDVMDNADKISKDKQVCTLVGIWRFMGSRRIEVNGGRLSKPRLDCGTPRG